MPHTQDARFNIHQLARNGLQSPVLAELGCIATLLLGEVHDGMCLEDQGILSDRWKIDSFVLSSYLVSQSKQSFFLSTQDI